MKDFILLCKAIAGSNTGARIRRRTKKKNQGYSFFSSNLFSQIMAGLIISLVFGFQFYINIEFVAGAGSEVLTQLFTNTSSSYFIALFGLCTLNVLNIFFLSRNDEAIVSFPIAPGRIFLARLILSLGYALLYALLFLTIGIIYLIFSGGSVLSFISLFITFLTLPFLFISISFLIINTIGLIVNFKKHKKTGIIISIFVSIIAFAAFYLPSIFGTGETEQEIIESLNTMNMIYANLEWVSYIPMKAIMLNGDLDWIYLILQVVITLGLVGLSYFYANATYIKNIGLEEGKSKKKISRDATEKRLNKSFNRIDSKGIKSYANRTVKEILHSPQIAMMFIFVPVFIGIVLGTSFAFIIPEILSEITLANSIDYTSFSIFIITAFCIVSSMTMTGSSIAVSSEHKNIALIKSSPIDPKAYLDSRIILSTFITISVNICLSIAFVMIGNFPPIYILYLLLELIPASILFNYINVWCDLIIPRFNWNNISEITNNSWKPFFNMIMNFVTWIVTIAICSAFIFVPSELAFIGPVTVGLILSALSLLFRHFASVKFNSLMNSDISY